MAYGTNCTPNLIESEIVKVFPHFTQGTKEQDAHQHIDIINIINGCTVDVKQPLTFPKTPLTWAINVLTDNGRPGALFGQENYIALTNLYEVKTSHRICALHNTTAFMYLLDRKWLIRKFGIPSYDNCICQANNDTDIEITNNNFGFSESLGIYFKSCSRKNENSSKLDNKTFFLMINENFFRTYMNELKNSLYFASFKYPNYKYKVNKN